MHPLANAGLSAAAVTVLTWGLSLAHVTLPADVATALVALCAAGVHATALAVATLRPAAAPVIAALTPEIPVPAASPVNPSNIAAGH